MIYEEILHDELKNGMPDDIIAKGKATFDKRSVLFQSGFMSNASSDQITQEQHVIL